MKKVLIFDDEPDILELTKLALKNDYDVYTKSSLHDDPVPIVDELGPDIILMDVKIPSIGGQKAVQLLKDDKRTKDIKIIFFSANHEISTISKNAGADGYFSKPFRVKQLKKFLAEQLADV